MNCFVYPLIKGPLGLPIVSDLHALESAQTHEPGLERPSWDWPVRVIYEKLALKFSDAVITPTEELREFLDRRYHKRSLPFPTVYPI